MSSAALQVTTPEADRIMPLRHPHAQPHTCDGSPQTRKGLCSWIKWKALRWEKLWGHPGARSHCTSPHQQRRRVRAGDWRTEAAGSEGATGHMQMPPEAGKGQEWVPENSVSHTLEKRGSLQGRYWRNSWCWGNSTCILIESLKRSRSRNRWKPFSPDTDTYPGPMAGIMLDGTPTPLSRRPVRPPLALSPCCQGAGVVRKGKKPEGQHGKEIGKMSTILG